MGAVHPFVAEVLRELIDAFETAHNQAFQIKFVGYAEIEGDVEGIMVGDERTRRRSSWD